MELSGEVNQQHAYKLAGYKCRGKTAKTEASRTLSLPQVKKYLAGAREDMSWLAINAVEKPQGPTPQEC